MYKCHVFHEYIYILLWKYMEKHLDQFLVGIFHCWTVSNAIAWRQEEWKHFGSVKTLP